MTETKEAIAPVVKSITVSAGPERAFAVFASDMGSWWPRSHSIGKSPLENVIVEPRTGGRWIEQSADGEQCQWGQVLLWDPPRQLVLAWQITGAWKYDPALVTEVDVRFTEIEPGRTRVDLEHRNMERFGESAAQVRDAVDGPNGWPMILESFATAAGA